MPTLTRQQLEASLKEGKIAPLYLLIGVETYLREHATRAIAEAANVAPETVYATFGNKRALLSDLVDISIAGGVDAPAVLDQAWVRPRFPGWIAFQDQGSAIVREGLRGRISPEGILCDLQLAFRARCLAAGPPGPRAEHTTGTAGYG